MIKTSTLKVLPKITTPIKKVYILILMTLFVISSMNAQTIDFDAVYGNTGDVVGNIQLAITSASAGDVILFKSQYYNLDGGFITITKELTFKGLNPVDFNAAAFGATGIQTTLDNVARIAIQSNNVKFENFSVIATSQEESVFDILIDARHPSYLSSNPIAVDQQAYTGLEFKNIVLSGAAYSFHSGNGVGITMSNVSMIEWRRIGFWVNRLGRSNSSPKMIFKNCSIIPEDSIINFDDRGVSFDAGNSEYPVIWDLNNTTFDTCYFKNTGIAYSRCEDSTIKGCTFEDEAGAIDLIHIEEFSNNVRVQNNVFDCKVSDINRRTRISQLDRDLQPIKDIVFTDNRIIGSYNFFISTYAPQNLTITGNDFTAATAVNNNSIDLGFFESRDREPITGELVANNVIINNNLGLGEAKNKGFRAFFPINGAVFTVNGYTNAQKTITRVNPKPAVVSNGVYEIQSIETGEKLAVNSGGFGLTTTNSSSTDSQWKITFSPPFSYFIQNVSNDRYLETHVGYTEFDVITNQPQNVSPFLNDVAGNNPKPFWAIQQDTDGDFEIFPGGNERQSIIDVNGGSPRLSFTISIDAMGVRSNLPLSDNVKWKFVEISGTTPPVVSGQTPFGGTARAIPGTINSVDFDNGGEGVAYHDTTSGNVGPGPRQDTNVDTENRVAVGNVGWIAKDEWLEYTVNVATAGTYTIDVQVASAGNNGAFHIEFGGADVSGIQSVSTTGGWGNFVNKTITNVSLAAGEQVMRIYMDGGSFNLGTINFTATSSNTNNTAAAGLIIEAETFNATGGTFNDASAGGPGLGANDNGPAINYVNAGDWVEYIVVIPEAGAYEIEYLIGAPQNGSKIDFSVSGTFFNSTNVPSTGGFDSYQALKAVQTATFTAGTHLIRLTASGNTWAWNLDKFTLKKVTGTNLKISLDNILEKEVRLYPNPVQSELHFENVEAYHSVNIYNLVGMQVLSQKLETNYLNLSNLIDGIYMLELISDTKTEMKKIVVRH